MSKDTGGANYFNYYNSLKLEEQMGLFHYFWPILLLSQRDLMEIRDHREEYEF